jgi:hypothetical protein
MHENKFEKEVREKMDQLGFDPPETVWARVNQEINQEKKKRRPLFWIFFLSGLVLGGGGVYMTMQNKLSNRTDTAKPNWLAGKHPDSVQSDKKQEEKKVPKGTTAQEASSKTNLKATAPDTARGLQSVRNQNFGSRSADIKKQTGKIPVPVTEKSDEEMIKDYSQVPLRQVPNDDIMLRKDSPVVAGVKEQKANKTIPADSASALKTTNGKKQNLKTSPWSIGITGTAGISNINQGLFQSANAASNSYSSYTPSNSSAAPPSTRYTSANLQSGFSFALGVFVNRSLSKRASMSAGINYHYYSTKINTGNLIDSVIYVYTANASYGQPGLAAVSTFYRNGVSKEYTNQYHFVELPVNLILQMNKSRKNPLNWEAGFSLAWLLGTNALHFDPNTNVYFENSQLFNKTQWNAVTAVLYGFPVHEHTILLGPQIQYGLSGLLKTNTASPGHLFYFGIKMSFLP